MKRIFADESGAVAVIVALLVVAFVGLSALVVDMGYLYNVRRQLQAAADAAALAGCQELIKERSEAEILAEAEEYAQHNAVKPGDGLVMVTSPPQTEVTEKYVKVTVRKQVNLFFAPVLGLRDKWVAAQSKAQIAYLTGAKGLVPLGVPIIDIPKGVAVRINGGAEIPLGESGSDWVRSIPVTLPPNGAGYPVTVIVYNGQTQYPDGTSDPAYANGVPETLALAETIVVRQETTGTIKDVSLSKNYVASGETGAVDLLVETSSESTGGDVPEYRFNGGGYKKLDAVAGSPRFYSKTLTVPTVDDLVKSFPIDVAVGQGVERKEILSAEVLVVRRSTYPVENVIINPRFFSSGGGMATVTVVLNTYKHDWEYELKVVGGGGEVGSFCALDFDSIFHPPSWKNPDAPEYQPSTEDPAHTSPSYQHYLEHPFPFDIHLGDTIWTKTGNMAEPTDSSLDDRFAGDSIPWKIWHDDLGSPESSPRVVYVPVVEKMQTSTGNTPMRVVRLAAFYVEPTTGGSGSNFAIRGRFIKYVLPSDDISDEPTGKYYIETPHLVTPDF